MTVYPMGQYPFPISLVFQARIRAQTRGGGGRVMGSGNKRLADREEELETLALTLKKKKKKRI